ncbi:hypothetical protein [Glutamicibacter sp. BSL13]
MTDNYWEARDSEVFRQGLNAGYKQGYRHGLEDGHKQGWNAADAAAESHAEHAARLFYTMEAGEKTHREFAKSAQDAISIHAARQRLRPKTSPTEQPAPLVNPPRFIAQQ